MRARASIALLLLGATALMALLLRDFVTQFVAVPVLRVLSLIQLAFGLVPQPLLWILSILLALAVALLSLFRLRERDHEPPRKSGRLSGRVQEIRRLLDHRAEGLFFKRQIARQLGDLTAEALEHTEGIPLDQASDRIRSGNLEAPEQVRAFLQAGLQRVRLRPKGLRARIARMRGQLERGSPLEVDPDGAVAYLEELLEIADER
jgi:hypothetical protein